MPGGADSNFRTWGDDTVYVDRGKGGRVWDIDRIRVAEASSSRAANSGAFFTTS